MRQKCEYCGTYPEMNSNGTCPNCGGGMSISFPPMLSRNFNPVISPYATSITGSSVRPMYADNVNMSDIERLARKLVYGN